MSVGFVEVSADGTVTRHRVDSVGNNLTAELHWCSTHDEPVWVYGDGSYGCPYDYSVGWSPDEHVIGPGPWLVREKA